MDSNANEAIITPNGFTALRVNLLGDYKEKRVVEGVVTAKVRFLVGCEDKNDAIDTVKELFDDHYDEIVNNSFLREGITSLVCEVADVGENLVVNTNEERPQPMFKSEDELSVAELNKFTIGSIVKVNHSDGWTKGQITDFYWDREKGKWMYSYDEVDGDGCENDIPEDRIEEYICK